LERVTSSWYGGGCFVRPCPYRWNIVSIDTEVAVALGYELDDDDDDVFDNPCTALDLQMCCTHPAQPLVHRAMEVADAVDRALRGSGRAECAPLAAELARLMRPVPGLLAQIHAVLPAAGKTTAAQLLCPVGRLAGALDQLCTDGCRSACGDPVIPGRRPEFAAIRPLLAECSAALRTALGGRPRQT
jgi:hypothetical protein